MSRTLLVLAFLVCLAGLPILTGCFDAGGPSPGDLKIHQTRLTMAEEPEDGLQTVVEVRNALLGIEEVEHDHEDHAGHDHAEEAEDDHDHDEEAEHNHDEHAGHDHGDHAGHDHEGHDHAAYASGPMEVLLLGKVGGLTNPWEKTEPDYPFRKKEAVVFLSDPAAVAEREAEGHVHAPGEECAFCAAHAAETSEQVAMIRFLDKDGMKVLSIPSQQLFDLDLEDTVVVKGTARVIEGGMMVVDATGIYVRR